MRDLVAEGHASWAVALQIAKDMVNVMTSCVWAFHILGLLKQIYLLSFSLYLNHFVIGVPLLLVGVAGLTWLILDIMWGSLSIISHIYYIPHIPDNYWLLFLLHSSVSSFIQLYHTFYSLVHNHLMHSPYENIDESAHLCLPLYSHLYTYYICIRLSV